MSETNKNNDSTKPKKPSIRHLKNMSYMEILENYAEYPQKNLKFNYLSASLKDGNAYSTASESGQKVHLVFDGVKFNKAKFLSEKEKAEGWEQVFSQNKKFSKFFQTNLHFLPEHLWSKLQEFNQDGVLVGYKVRDVNNHFFVHSADTDENTKHLFNAIKNRHRMDKDLVQNLLNYFEEKGIESWLTIRAKEYMQ
tara:strand:+ start:116 stop:700 length:585 start_codon:yes stop_codon:yes gene_type:complete